ncbi:MAG: aldehyde dehydrogenase family protein [Deltaproteobacteria bacterium]|nr:aldehyde dehydrogenase family protein [Deltaproteobacteria bacterium]
MSAPRPPTDPPHDPPSGPAVPRQDPHSLADLGVMHLLAPAQVEARLAAAAADWRGWAGGGVGPRLEAMGRLAGLLRRDRDRLAALMTAEVGKRIAESEAEVDKCAAALDHAAAAGAGWVAPRTVAAKAWHSEVQRRPAGLVLAILPWNFPLWQAVRVLVSAWPGGNGALLKPAPTALGCAEALAALAAEAGVGPGGLSLLPVEIDQVARLIADPRVRAVTLTGSEQAGRAVAALAGAQLKPYVLELGGSDAFIVLADADVEAAARAAVAARLLNNGQSCIAAKRFFVEHSVLDGFLDVMLHAFRAIVVGDPADRAVGLGPLHRADLRDQLEQQVTASLRGRRARLLHGGRRLEGPAWPGHHFAPTLILDPNDGSPAACTETFGPLAPVWGVRDAVDAVLRANDSRYGLCASIWSADHDRARALAAELDVGGVFVNEAPYSHPALPFGGVKCSGLGRELGAEGAVALLDTCTLTFAAPPAGGDHD